MSNQNSADLVKLGNQLSELFDEMMTVLTGLNQTEERKRDLLLQRNTHELRPLLDKQSALTLELDKLETRREWLLAQFSFSTGRARPEKLSDIIAWPELSLLVREKLKEKLRLLSDAMTTLKAASQANVTLVEDARNLYHEILSSAGRADTATGAAGRPVFVNISC